MLNPQCRDGLVTVATAAVSAMMQLAGLRMDGRFSSMHSPDHSSCPALLAADALLGRRPLLGNPWLSALADGSMDRPVFVRSQQQFFYAVRFFSRPMAALAARIPDSAGRQVLLHNLSEEHGWDDEGPSGFQPEMAHDRTFRQFLKSLGAEPAEREGPAVRAFNLGLLGACQAEPLPLALSCLGMVEYMFADISALIGKAVVERGWIAPDDLVHYKLHAEIDKRPAAEFFGSVGAGDARAVDDGLALGQHLFDQLYRNLLDA